LSEAAKAEQRSRSIPRQEPLTEAQQRLASLTEQAQAARTEYARLSAGRANRRVFKGSNAEFSKAAVDRAKEQYRYSKQALIGQEKLMAQEAGVSQADLTWHGEEFAIGEAKRLINAVHRQRLAATGKFVLNAAGMPEWQGAPTRGRKVAKHFNPRSKTRAHVDKLSDDLREALYEHGHAEHLGVIIDGQTENEVYLNKRRVLGATAMSAASQAATRLGHHYAKKIQASADRWVPDERE
jgi:hypothetical protein